MNLEKKVNEWSEKGLIAKEQASAIVAYEKHTNPSNLLTNTFLTLGVSIISLGILAFIAANWENISGNVKLIIDFMILSGAAWYIYYLSNKEKIILRDRMIVFFQLMILVSIGLISQVFHTSGKLYEALFLWIGITLPIVLHAQNKFPSHILFIAVYGSTFIFFIDIFDMYKRSVVFVVQLLIPITFLLIGILINIFKMKSIQRFGLSSIFWGTLSIMLGTFGLHFLEPFDADSKFYSVSILYFSVSSLILSFLIFKIKKVSSIFVLLIAILYLGIYLLRVNGKSTDFFDALFFIFIWIFIGLLFLNLRYNRIFELSIVVVGLRFLVVYFQIFDSLLMTSLGLVLSGFLILLVVYLYVKNKDKIYSISEKYL